jgi:predicted nucleic acid-binding protein
MVLVDTSLWIRFLANKSPSMVELKTLLDREEVAGHELVFGELLIGDKGGRKAVLSEYSHIRWMPTIPHRELATFV